MLVFLIACVQTALTPVVDDTGASATTPPCDTRLVASWPADGALDVWTRPAIAVQLDPPDPTASLTLTDASGDPVKGSHAVQDNGAHWTLALDDALSPATDYQLELDSCAGVQTLAFTTVDDPGLPPELGQAMLAYQFDPRFGRAIQPTGLNDALAPLWPADPWLIGVAGDASSLSLSIGAGSAQLQDTCVATHDLPTVTVDDTHLALGPDLATLELEVGSVGLYNFSLSGTFAHDGGELAGVEVSLLLDARDLAQLDLMGDSAEDVCALLATEHVVCEDCGDGVDACVSARWDSITAPILDALAFEQIPSPDCHPTCAESFTNPLCNTTGWE